MGAIFSPIYANLCIAYLEEYEFPKHCTNSDIYNYFINQFKRFLDDCFILINPYIISPNELLIYLNSLNSSIKYIMKTNKTQIAFLDILILKDNININTDIYYKDTNNQLYLNFHSNHPRHIKRNIPYNLFKRVNLIVSDQKTKIKRKLEIFNILKNLNYPRKLLIDAFNKSTVTMNLINNSNSNSFEIINHIIPYNRQTINKNYFNDKIQNILPFLENVNSPLNKIKVRTVNTQPNNILSLLKTNANKNKYVKKCGLSRCQLCKEIVEVKNKIIVQDRAFYINANMNCKSRCLVYMLACCSCGELYVGKTGQKIHKRINLHRSQVFNSSPVLPVSRHLRKCSLGKFSVYLLYSVPNFCPLTLDAAEKYFIAVIMPKLNY